MFPHAKLWIAVVAMAVFASSAEGDVIINWADPSVSITVIDAQNASVIGNTTGDQIVPFRVLISTTATSQQVSRLGPLGNDPNPLNLNLPATRLSTSLMTVDISIPGYKMVNTSFNLLDIDAASQNLPPFGSWQDQVTFLNPTSGFSFTPVIPARYAISGNQITAVLGPNIANGSTDANVNALQSGSSANIRYVYGPGPFDLLGQNQRHGISIITIESLSAIPEPGMAVAIPFAVIAIAIWRRRKPTRG